MTSPAAFEADLLARRLAGRRFGWHLMVWESIASTSDVALELLESGAPEGTLVLAEEQTRGRGRRGRDWVSLPRLGIYASLILRPARTGADLPLLTFAAAVAGARSLGEASGVDIRIQWPNDLKIGEKKVAGFLAESRQGPGGIGVVVGVGINVHHAVGDFPAALRDTATSLRIASGRSLDRGELLAGLLAAWEEEDAVLRDRGAAELLARWSARSALAPGARIRVEAEGEIATGSYAGVGPGGELRLEAEDGTIRRITFGDVVRLREEA